VPPGAALYRLGEGAGGLAFSVVTLFGAGACGGGGEVKLRNEAWGKVVPSAAGTQTCDGSLFRTRVDVPGPAAVIGFAATPVEDDADGGYAYAYYVEKKNLP